ncbi:hypothetical protein J437_LFUL000973 [Ladona fulva]|uniref:Major facilitator superfamily associated domain-containing protein n=1 Tax=Ladona fulva TaxID=123851 RepID=A0A8K0P7A3_LADFU|nr:hypothetical protein J437_LFUL000973 [Ladona fulva]
MDTSTEEKFATKEKNSKYSEDKKSSTRVGKFLQCMHINPNLVMLKITQFVLYGAIASLLPYLTIHMQSIGLTVEEIAVIYLALPFTTFLSPPLTGFLVDRFGKYKPVVVVALLLNAGFHHALLLIPPMELPGSVPPAYVARHPVSGSFEVWWSPCPSRECPDIPELELVLANCTDYCSIQPPVEPGSLPTLPPGLLALVTDSQTMPFTWKIPQSSTPFPQELSSTRDGHLIDSGSDSLSVTGYGMSGEEVEDETSTVWYEYGSGATEDTGVVESTEESTLTSVSASGGNRSEGDVLIHRGGRRGNRTKSKSSRKELIKKITSPFKFKLKMHPDLAEPIEQLGIEVDLDSDESVMIEEEDPMDSSPEDQLGNVGSGSDIGSSRFNGRFANRLLEGVGINSTVLEEEDLRCGGIVLSSNATREFLQAMIPSSDGKWCILQKCTFRAGGPEVCPPDYIESDDRVFWIYFFLRFMGTMSMSAGVTMLDPIALTMIQKYGGEFGRERMFSTFGMALFSPITGFFIDQSSRKLGLTLTVGTLSSMPFLYGAENITQRFGHVNIIIVAFFSHAARLMGYSFIDNAWWSFPFEAIEALAVHLMWVAAATYCATICPKNLLATLIGVLGMAHFSLGRGSGSFVGGFLLGSVGTRESFRIMGYLAGAGGVLYGILHYFWLKKLQRPAAQEEVAENAEMEDGEDIKDPELANLHPEKIVTPALERLSLMIQVTQRGSLTDIPHYTKGSNDSGLNGSSVFGPHRGKTALAMKDFNRPRNSIATTMPYSGTGTPINQHKPFKGGSPFGSQHLLQRTSSVGSPAGRIWQRGHQPASPKGISKLAMEDGKCKKNQTEKKQEQEKNTGRDKDSHNVGENNIKQSEKEMNNETSAGHVRSEVLEEGQKEILDLH